jgi:heme oxygenase
MKLRDRLKAETSPYHERLERRLSLTESVRSKNEYIHLLKYFYGFYSPFETEIARFEKELGEGGFELNPRFKSGLIVEDLLALGCKANDISNLPHCSYLPSLSVSAQALGCLYVVEGSTLGGQFIARHFRNTLEMNQESGCRFFTGYGAETGKMWQAFVLFLNSQGETMQNQTEVVRSACSTFECLENWLSSRD